MMVSSVHKRYSDLVSLISAGHDQQTVALPLTQQKQHSHTARRRMDATMKSQ